MRGKHPLILRIVSVALAAGLVGAAAPAAAHNRNDDYRTNRHRIERRARSQTGASYRYGGSSPQGFDCSGFTRWVYQGYADLPHSSQDQFYMGKRDGFVRIWKRDALEVGDLVFHKTTGARVGHAGIYVGGGKFISSTSSSGVQVRSLYDSYWGPRWVGGVRTPATIRYDKRR
jgi:cell wall-associated NlpC family hydrolase